MLKVLFVDPPRYYHVSALSEGQVLSSRAFPVQDAPLSLADAINRCVPDLVMVVPSVLQDCAMQDDLAAKGFRQLPSVAPAQHPPEMAALWLAYARASLPSTLWMPVLAALSTDVSAEVLALEGVNTEEAVNIRRARELLMRLRQLSAQEAQATLGRMASDRHISLQEAANALIALNDRLA